MTQLLVSVRSAAEAEAALRGGAALIDVKEPALGSLGRASATILADVVHAVASRCPVSAALGEMREPFDLPLSPSLAYVKWGLADCREDWQRLLSVAMRCLTQCLPNCRIVAVAYADWRQAHAPPPEEVCSFAIENSMGAFLLDTWRKDGSTLLDGLSLEEIERLHERCRSGEVPIALAGSLGVPEIETLLPLRPDWFAVRGAVCQGRQRGAAIEEGKVRQLAALVSDFG